MHETFGGDTAFPVSQETVRNLNNPYQPGLTKREHFAALAMQGMLAGGRDAIMSPEQLTEIAVSYADALIGALRK